MSRTYKDQGFNNSKMKPARSPSSSRQQAKEEIEEELEHWEIAMETSSVVTPTTFLTRYILRRDGNETLQDS